LFVLALKRQESVGLKLWSTRSVTTPREKREKMRFQQPNTRFVCSNITMTFKALFYKCYARKGP